MWSSRTWVSTIRLAALPALPQSGQASARTEHEITDTGHVDDGRILADRIDHAGKLGDHRAAPAICGDCTAPDFQARAVAP